MPNPKEVRDTKRPRGEILGVFAVFDYKDQRVQLEPEGWRSGQRGRLIT